MDPGMALKPFPSSIGWDSNPWPFDLESSTLTPRPDFLPFFALDYALDFFHTFHGVLCTVEE